MKQISFDELLTEDAIEDIEIPTLSLLHHDIMALLESGETSALEIFEKLIVSGRILKDAKVKPFV
ncbi:hypothetical protein RCG19_12080 [Neobacillus sp. OS1-2]|uniref:hypothetical protein n=1 Tax=Neobacillus sp. OS1-2 TaxID=3070680 RepID=UPI0027E1A1CF|nr:hypothetical protein [Neobacillus sp. OS1-2]WML37986.1 hypothetical protein RCG19_12080 [Neobacillus sp. OS1-2]